MKPLKTILFICLLLNASFAYSQGGTHITRIPKKISTFQIGIIGSVDLCFRTLENKQRETSIDQLMSFRNQTETFKFGYHTGINLGVNISEHFGMEVGVIYANKGWETTLMNFIYPVPDPTLPEKGRSIYNCNFIDVPLRANFYAGKGKVRFYGSFGIVTNILVSQNETFVKKFADGRTEYEVYDTNHPFEKVVFSGTVSAGIDIRFNKFLSLRAAPNFSHNIGRFVDDPMSDYLWTAGFGASVHYGWY